MAVFGAMLVAALFSACGSGSSGSEDGELQEATEVVRDFYRARVSGDDATACSHMSQALRRKLEGLAERTSARGCAPFLEAFTGELPDAARRKMDTVDAVRLSREGGQVSLVYRGADDAVYEMPLAEEDGEWKVSELSAFAAG